MADVSHPLYSAFRVYSTFGDKTATSMDSARFMKMVKEGDLLDGRLDRQQVDLIFTKAKARTERKLSFPDFLVGINLIAACKWPNTDESVARRLVTDRICTAAAKLGSHTTKVESDGIFSKLTDSRLYTGAHKHRFDEEGHGKGIAGRDSVSKGAGGGAGKYHGGAVSDLSQITRSNLVGGGTTTMKVSRVITAGPTGTTRGTTSSHGK